MAEIFQIQAKDAVLKLNHYSAINAVQSFDWDPSFNEEYYDELGNAAHAAQSITPEVSGSFESTATGSTVALLKRMINRFDPATGAYQGYMAGTTPDNAGTITHLDLERAIFDIIEAKKANETFTRATLLPRCYLTSLALNADANGAATETYSFEGEMAEVYRGARRDVVSMPGTRGSDTTINVAAGALTGATLIQVMVDEVVIPAANAVVGTAAGTTDTITVTGYVVKAGARIAVHAYYNTPGAFPTIQYPTTSRFHRADDIDLWLVPKTSVDIAALAPGALNTRSFADAELFLRCQSASISVDLQREALRQIKKNPRNNAVFYRAATYPLNVTASLAAFETDLADWQRIQGKTATDTLNLGDFEGKEYQVVMRYYKGDTVLQTTVLLDGRVSGRSARVSVGGRAEATWSMTGSALRIEGSNG